MKPNSEKILVYIGVFYCIIFDMAFFGVFPSLMQMLGTLLIVGTDVALIAYNIVMQNEAERQAKIKKEQQEEQERLNSRRSSMIDMDGTEVSSKLR